MPRCMIPTCPREGRYRMLLPVPGLYCGQHERLMAHKNLEQQGVSAAEARAIDAELKEGDAEDPSSS
jgi:hypothetical protein